MKEKDLELFKKLLLQHKESILNGQLLSTKEDLHISSDDLSDEADLASNVISQEVSFNLRNRELGKLRLIDSALLKVKDGSFGLCEDCDEPIAKKRLTNQPWALFCIEHAEERERNTMTARAI